MSLERIRVSGIYKDGKKFKDYLAVIGKEDLKHLPEDDEFVFYYFDADDILGIHRDFEITSYRTAVGSFGARQ